MVGLLAVIAGLSVCVCQGAGVLMSQSISLGMFGSKITVRWVDNLSHRIKMNSSRAINDIIDPLDETTFHFVNLSG